MPKLEKKIEREVAQYAREKGCMALKLTILGRVGWPDYIFLYPIRRVMFIEFKREGERPRQIQVFICNKLRAMGFAVAVCDNVEVGKNLINLLTGLHYESRVATQKVPV
jgi:hypothetical protein